jgi:hypothetical protein
MPDREERIRRRAHEIWELAGRPLGEDIRHWEQAAREIDEEDAAAAGEAGSASPDTSKDSGSKQGKA